MSAVELAGVTLALGGRRVLANASLSIADGAFVGVLGPNGAGKTSLMRAILGLVPVAAGTVRVLGVPPGRGNPAVGYLPQASGTSWARLSGRDFVAAAWHGQCWGLPILGAAGRAAVARALDQVEAGGFAARPMADLSGGERQRLMLAQALLGEPKLLLLDEPLASLDPRHQRGAVDLVRRLQRTLGITVLFSAHDLNPLLGALDQVLYLGGGHAALGSVDTVVTGPVLSRLYGAPMDVVRSHGRIFVVAAEADAPAGTRAMAAAGV